MIIPSDTIPSLKNNSKRFQKFQQIVVWLATIYVWVAGGILIYWLILKITGHSPTALDILIVLNTVILSAMIIGGLTIGIKLGNLERTSKQFDSLSRDFKKHLELYHK